MLPVANGRPHFVGDAGISGGRGIAHRSAHRLGDKIVVPADIQGIYVLGCAISFWPCCRKRRKCVRGIEGRQAAVARAGPNRQEKGFYGYTLSPGGEHHSPSQFGVLGMWQLSEAGVEVPKEYWQTVDTAWRARRPKAASGTIFVEQ